MNEFCGVLAGATKASSVPADLIADASAELVMLAVASGNVRWIEEIFRMRQRFELPLDAAAAETLAKRIAELPAATDSARRAYIAWLQAKPLTFTERAALKRLGEARGR
jgi:hypothetical protein